MSGTEVTCRDTETGETEVITIEDDWLLITDGVYDLAHVNHYANGTSIITVKKTAKGKEK